MKRVFISWSRETEPVAQALASWISDSSSDTKGWVSSIDIVGGRRWREEIDTALAHSACAIACLGPSSVKSAWVLYETGAVGSQKPVIPIALSIPTHKLPATLAELQILNAFPAPKTVPTQDLPDRLARALNAAVDVSLQRRTPEVDGKLLLALRTFADERVSVLRERLKSTKRSEMFVEMLRYIGANPCASPRSLSEHKMFSDLFGKKHLAACALFWLRDNELVEIADFDNITSGRVSLAYDGELVLSNIDD